MPGFLEGKRVLVTGGTGMLGRRLAPRLAAEGCAEVLALGSKQCDLTDPRRALDLFSGGYDVVVHGASIQGGLGFILRNRTEVLLANARIHANVLEAARRYPPDRFIGIGSSCAYPGDRSDLKEEEFWDGPPAESVLTYGVSKRLLFVGQDALFKEAGIQGAHLVLNNLYGPEDRFDSADAHVVASLIAKFESARRGGGTVEVWGDGTAERELLYVDDAVEGIVRSVSRLDSFRLLNIAAGRPTRIRDLAETIARVVGHDRFAFDPSKPTGTPRKSLNGSRCRELLGWVPATPLEEGIARTVEWARAAKRL